ncbi:MAG TPA: diheme cytochrome c-553 [Casimicrobiaceae bacterium]|nr:diheme cytochrome c-553 [Casimicrobiaceae bacterium]
MNRSLINTAVLAAAVLPCILPGGITPVLAQDASTQAARVERGRYIVTTSGCHDCHTPWVVGPKGPEPDMTRALSGHPESMTLPPPPKAEGPWIMTAAATNTAWAGPWGISFTANLTPDPETGLGKWTLRNFVETIRTGRHMGRGRPVLPPMPVQVYRNWTDADFAAVFAYLQSVPAVKNRVPEPLPPAAPVASAQ